MTARLGSQNAKMNPPAPTQISFAQAEYDKKKKRTRREVFLEKVEQVVPWSRLMEVIEPRNGSWMRPSVPRAAGLARRDEAAHSSAQ